MAFKWACRGLGVTVKGQDRLQPEGNSSGPAWRGFGGGCGRGMVGEGILSRELPMVQAENSPAKQAREEISAWTEQQEPVYLMGQEETFSLHSAEPRVYPLRMDTQGALLGPGTPSADHKGEGRTFG